MLGSLLIALALHASVPLPQEAEPAERLSVEDLLARFRERRDELLGALRGEVALALADLEASAGSGGPNAVKAGFDALVKLGPASAPLLVPAIDPGPGPADAQVTRARTVTRVLREFRSAAITDALLAILNTGTVEGRRNAMRVLGTSADTNRVSAALREFYAEAKSESRLYALSALAELGGDENERFLSEQLASEDRQVAGYALSALSSAGGAGAAGQVLALLRRTNDAAALVGPILAYYRAVPRAVDGATCEALLALVQSRKPTGVECVQILDFLPDFDRQWSSSFKRELKGLVDSSSRDVGEAALVALARTGDRGAKKTLLAPYDQRVDDQRNWANVWEERGAVHYRIRDYRSALRDYQEALSVGRDGGRFQGQVHVQIARCLALTGKLKDAADRLEKAPITLAERRALAADPVFADLASNSRYRGVFRLDG